MTYLSTLKYTASVILVSAISTLPSIADEKEDKEFKWTFATIELIETGDVKRGEKIAKEQKCSKCHGDTGISDEDDTPSIAGQTASYNFKQMMDYKHGSRDEKTMTKRVRKLNEQEIADMSAWYATQKAEPSVSKGKKPPTLVTEGDMSRLLLPCKVCHGKNGEGFGYEAPALTGQKQEHFIETMTAFKDQDRENDHYSRMRFIAGQLTEEEIEALAAFYGAKPLEEED